MRGRTNIGGGGGMSINGILSSGVVDTGQTIGSGDFVEYKTFNSDSKITSLYVEGTKAVKLDSDYFVLLSFQNKLSIGSTTQNGQLRLCKQNEAGSEILEEVTLGVADMVYYNNKLYVYMVNSSTASVKVYTRNGNSLSLVKTIASKAFLRVIDMFINGSNIILYGQEDSTSYITYLKYSVDSSSNMSIVTEKKYSVYTGSSCPGETDETSAYLTFLRSGSTNYLYLYKIGETELKLISTIYSGSATSVYFPWSYKCLVYSNFYLLCSPVYTSSSTAGSTNIQNLEIWNKSTNTRVTTVSIATLLGLTSTTIKSVSFIHYFKVGTNKLLIHFGTKMRLFKFDESGPALVQLGSEYTASTSVSYTNLINALAVSDNGENFDLFVPTFVNRVRCDNDQLGPSVDTSVVRQWAGDKSALLGIASDSGSAGETIGVYIPDTNV